jgi:hypothetical protein
MRKCTLTYCSPSTARRCSGSGMHYWLELCAERTYAHVRFTNENKQLADMGGVGDFKGGLDSDAVVVPKRAKETAAAQKQSRKPSVKYVFHVYTTI